MIIPRYHIGPSQIAGAGKGLFLDEPIARGRVIVAPDAIPRVHSFEDIERMPDAAELLPATVRWFENAYTVTPEWPDECYVNHAFEPTGLWHLGFVFAAADLPAGTEITGKPALPGRTFHTLGSLSFTVGSTGAPSLYGGMLLVGWTIASSPSCAMH